MYGCKARATTLCELERLVQVENRGDEGQLVGASLACHGSTALTSSRDRPLEDPNVMFAGAVSGMLFYSVFCS